MNAADFRSREGKLHRSPQEERLATADRRQGGKEGGVAQIPAVNKTVETASKGVKNLLNNGGGRIIPRPLWNESEWKNWLRFKRMKNRNGGRGKYGRREKFADFPEFGCLPGCGCSWPGGHRTTLATTARHYRPRMIEDHNSNYDKNRVKPRTVLTNDRLARRTSISSVLKCAPWNEGP